ncbi:MAG: hypothetical protein ACFFCO_02560 [Promethearchaeota archaeon]
MGKLGFVLLLFGGILMLLYGLTQAIQPDVQQVIIQIVNALLGPYVPGIGQLVVDTLLFASSFGGIGVIIGAIIWFAAGWGWKARVGMLIVLLSSIGAAFIVVSDVYMAYISGVFDPQTGLPLHEIVSFFAGFGMPFGAALLTFLGSLFGAGRKRPHTPTTEYLPTY